MNIKQLLM